MINYEIDEYFNLPFKSNEVYKPRKGIVGSNFELFSESQLQCLDTECSQVLQQLGYTLSDKETENCQAQYSSAWIDDFNSKMLELLVANTNNSQKS